MISFVMLVGPKEAEMAVDSLEWALKFYPDAVALVWDDRTSDGTFEVLQEFARSNNQRVFLERNEQPEGHFGIPTSMFRVYASLIERFPNLEMAIQLDPDACVLRPGIVELARQRFLRHGPGMIGSYRVSPSGALRDHRYWRNQFIKDLLPVGRDRKTGALRFGLPFYLPFLIRALKGGYRLGHHVLASFYVLHGDTIRALRDAGFWSAMPAAGSRNVKGDDPLLSLGTVAAGHRLIELNEGSGVNVETWIQFRPPLPLSAVEIVERRIIAVHPVKGDSEGAALRSELRWLLSMHEL